MLAKLSPLVTVDPDSVADIADLLVQHQAWPLVDQLAQQNEAIFKADPALLYTWAHSLREQGKTDESEKIADQAFKLIGKSAEEHAKMGQKLGRLGLFDAAEREYKHVIEVSPQDNELTIRRTIAVWRNVARPTARRRGGEGSAKDLSTLSIKILPFCNVPRKTATVIPI